MKNNNSKSVSFLPFDLQVAKKIVKEHTIWLVIDLEKGYRIPIFYKEKRFVKDKFGEELRGFIKAELLDIYSFYLNKDSFNGTPERCIELSKYHVSDYDLNKFLNNPGYLNILTKNILKNIIDFSELIKDVNEFDSKSTLVNAQNGIFDLELGELKEHTSDLLISNIINANFVFPCNDNETIKIDTNNLKGISLFYQVISDALLDETQSEIVNKQIVRSFMEVLSSFLIGNNLQKLFYIIIGEPNTGKSTLLEVLLEIFGDYGTTFNNSAFLFSSRTSNDIRPDIIALKGKRLLAGSEANKSQKFDNALLKQISGNDKISVRKPHKGNMESFTISGKLLLVTNFCPMFSDLDDQAFINRIVLIDFNNVPNEFDKNLKEKLLTKESRDEIFSYLAKIACEIISKKEIFIHDRFKANKQRILVNQNNSVSLFWKRHIKPHSLYLGNGSFLPHHPITTLYNTVYLPFCSSINIKEPLSSEAFAKEFKYIADQFSFVNWHKGKSKNYYTGFNVVGGEHAALYNTIVFNTLYDPEKIFE